MVPATAGIGRINPQQASGIVVGQRLEQHRVRDAEYRSIGADAQRQRHYRNGCEARIFAELARAVSEILQQLIKPAEAPHVARDFFDQRDVAEFTNG